MPWMCNILQQPTIHTVYKSIFQPYMRASNSTRLVNIRLYSSILLFDRAQVRVLAWYSCPTRARVIGELRVFYEWRVGHELFAGV